MSDKNKYTTMAIKDSVLELFKSIDVKHHEIDMTSNSDKLEALILFYKNNK